MGLEGKTNFPTYFLIKPSLFSFFGNVPRMQIHTVETIGSCLHEVY